MTPFKIILGVSFMLNIGQLFGQNATKYSNEFLQIGVGARSLGMGGASVASANDVYAGYWNPAGLTSIDNNAQISLMHASYFAGIANYDYGAWASKISDNSALGISLIRFGVDGIANTFDLIRNGEIDYTRVSSFNTSDFAFILSYAQNQKIRNYKHLDFSWGGNLKIIRRKIGPFAKATGFGLDAGFKLRSEKRGNWSAGVVIRDVTSTFNSWRYTFTDAQKDILASTQNVIPQNTLEITLPRLIAGFAKTWDYKNWEFVVPDKGLLISHTYPDFNAINERMPDLRSIIITFSKDDLLEVATNMIHKNVMPDYRDLVTYNDKEMFFQKVNKKDYTMYYLAYINMYKKPMKLTPEFFNNREFIDTMIYLKYDTQLEKYYYHEFFEANTTVIDDNVLVIKFADIFKPEDDSFVALNQLRKFLKTTVSEETKQAVKSAYTKYVNNRTEFLKNNLPIETYEDFQNRKNTTLVSRYGWSPS
jgi:hypothetical protein